MTASVEGEVFSKRKKAAMPIAGTISGPFTNRATTMNGTPSAISCGGARSSRHFPPAQQIVTEPASDQGGEESATTTMTPRILLAASSE
jgi:hypothetical protein